MQVLTWARDGVDVAVLSLAVLILHALQIRHLVGFVVLLLGVFWNEWGGRNKGGYRLHHWKVVEGRKKGIVVIAGEESSCE